jgi:hypothetical protein
MANLLLWLFYLAAAIFSWYCWARIAKRLGYKSYTLIGLGMMIPGVNLLVLLSLVFTESPNEARLRGLGKLAEEWQDSLEEEVPQAHAGDPAPEDSPRQDEDRVTDTPPDPSRCPACGGAITTKNVRCPDCGILLR